MSPGRMQASHPMRDDTRFAATCSGQDQERSFRVFGRLPLPWKKEFSLEEQLKVDSSRTGSCLNGITPTMYCDFNLASIQNHQAVSRCVQRQAKLFHGIKRCEP